MGKRGRAEQKVIEPKTDNQIEILLKVGSKGSFTKSLEFPWFVLSEGLPVA